MCDLMMRTRNCHRKNLISQHHEIFSASRVSSCSSSSSDSGDSDVMGGPKSSESLELPVWIDGKEKWVTGLTRRTTCDDVIYALLLQASDDKIADVNNYILHERWRGMERPLRGRTKILRVWRAWGSENHNVAFILRKVDCGLDISCEVSKGKKVRRPKHSHHKTSRIDSRRPRSSSRSGTSKCVPEHVGDAHRHNGKAKAFHELVHTILEQEKEAHDQLHRIHEMDIQIDTFETKVHLSRMEQNGANYVQEAYLRDSGGESGSSGTEEGAVGGVRGKSGSRDCHSDEIAYLELRSSVLDIEEKLEAKQCKIAELAFLIKEENSLTSEGVPGQCDSQTEGDVIQRLRNEVNRCLRVSEEQTQYMQQIQATLTECEAQIQGKEDYLKCLESELEVVDSTCEENACDEGFHQDFISSGSALRNSVGLCMSEEQEHQPVAEFLKDFVESDKEFMQPLEESGHFIRDVHYTHSQGSEPLTTIPESNEYDSVETKCRNVINPEQNERIEKLKIKYMKSSNPDKGGHPDRLNCSARGIDDSSISFPPPIPDSPCGQGLSTVPEHLPGYSEGTVFGYKPYITYTNYACCRGPSSDSDSTDTGVGSLGSNEDGIGVLETLV